MPPACLNCDKTSLFLGAGVINNDQHVHFTNQLSHGSTAGTMFSDFPGALGKVTFSGYYGNYETT